MRLSDIEVLVGRLKDPEYFYLLLEPVALFGLFFGLIFFAVGLYLAQDKCRMAALIVIVLSCCSVYPMMKDRLKAEKNLLLDPKMAHVSVEAFKHQTQLRQDTKWVYYAVAAVALIALIAGGKLASWSNIVLLASGTLVVIFSVWLHMKEAEVHNPNIKRATKRIL